jgi:phage major head subunit gpT-like protein
MPGGSVLESNPGLIDTTMRTIRSSFVSALVGGVDESWREVAMEVPGASKKDIYKFITDMPGMKKWLGNRSTDGWKIDALEIENIPYEETIEIDEFDFDDDTVGTYAPIASQLGLEAARTPAEIVYGHLEAGFAANSYDGTTFFSTSHSFGSNRATGALTDVTFEAGMVAMRSYTTSSGKIIGLNRKIALLVPASLKKTANAIVGNQFLTDGTNNPDFGEATVVVADSLTDSTNWYLIGQNGILRPLMFQVRMAPRSRRDDSKLFDKHKIFFGVDARWGVAYGLPQMAYGAIVAG